MSNVLDLNIFGETYQDWLLTEMHAEDYSILFDILYNTPYEWILFEDGNRSSDGIYLRARFAYEHGLELPANWDEWPCSFLEMIVSLSFTMEESIMYDPDEATGAYVWFWMMMENCGLDIYSDKYLLSKGQKAISQILEIVNDIMYRRYDFYGHGGLFPLNYAKTDQRKVEYWNQMNEYVLELGLF